MSWRAAKSDFALCCVETASAPSPWSCQHLGEAGRSWVLFSLCRWRENSPVLCPSHRKHWKCSSKTIPPSSLLNKQQQWWKQMGITCYYRKCLGTEPIRLNDRLGNWVWVGGRVASSSDRKDGNTNDFSTSLLASSPAFNNSILLNRGGKWHIRPNQLLRREQRRANKKLLISLGGRLHWWHLAPTLHLVSIWMAGCSWTFQWLSA